MDENKLNPRILIVDDQENWRDVISDILVEDYQVSTVSSFDQAKLLIGENDYHVLILDIRLVDAEPGNEQGLQILENIREERGDFDTEVILVTGYPTAETATSALTDFQATHYFIKRNFDFAKFRDAVQKAAERAIVSKAQKSLVRQNILIVEDDLNWREVLTEVLEEDGYRVDAATNSQSAIEKLKTGLYRLVVVDLKLGKDEVPIEEGEQLLQHINAHLPSVQVIVVTGLSSQTLAINAFQHYNVRAFFQKADFDIQEFRSIVEDSFNMISERYVVAWIEELSVDDPLYITQTYKLKVNVQSGMSLKYHSAPFFVLPSAEIQQLKVVLYAEDMNISPSIVQTLELPATQQPQPIVFQLVPNRPGKKIVNIDIYQSDHLLVNLVLNKTCIIENGG